MMEFFLDYWSSVCYLEYFVYGKVHYRFTVVNRDLFFEPLAFDLAIGLLYLWTKNLESKAANMSSEF